MTVDVATVKLNPMTDTATFHEVRIQQPVLACDLCGAIVDPSDTGRAAHQAWHDQTVEVIDLTGRVALQLERIAS